MTVVTQGAIGVTLLVLSSLLMFLQTGGQTDEITVPGQPASGSSGRWLAATVLPFATLATLLLAWLPTLFG